jgi:pimeloyl-ACP methyl ester carboxylesterase
MLNTLTFGERTSRPPLLIVHGLFGSGRNWSVLARRLSDTRQVTAVDMRNHANSFWSDTHGYPDMADDLAQVIETLGAPADVIGHSMGGKASMTLALNYPDMVNRLLVADIAPVTYSHTQSQFIDAMRSVDLSSIEKRSDASEQLARVVDDKALQAFFTQSLDVKERRWKLNLNALEAEMPQIRSFPALDARFEKPALFLSGSQSDYVLPEHRPQIRDFFPKARFAKITGAGHWLHAEKPREFEESARAFFDA